MKIVTELASALTKRRVCTNHSVSPARVITSFRLVAGFRLGA
jgi:hypothetical protein